MVYVPAFRDVNMRADVRNKDQHVRHERLLHAESKLFTHHAHGEHCIPLTRESSATHAVYSVLVRGKQLHDAHGHALEDDPVAAWSFFICHSTRVVLEC